MSKGQKKVEAVKKQKKVFRGQKESQFALSLDKKVKKALNVLKFVKDKESQYVGNGVVLSGEQVRKALKVRS
ncbi:hypothetical protein ZPAH1_orf00147 [Aeromonas phage ZPAH1]|nr:hypothetical protein ASwh1_98 [Aeromonas phage Aswh_1]QQG33909.1 hypothetical protein ZPAH1_orf00147 [Aeromonas phage ZPAH1]